MSIKHVIACTCTMTLDICTGGISSINVFVKKDKIVLL